MVKQEKNKKKGETTRAEDNPKKYEEKKTMKGRKEEQ